MKGLVLILGLLISSSAIAADFPKLNCTSPNSIYVAQIHAGWTLATLTRNGGGWGSWQDTFGCKKVEGPATGRPQEILWCQQTRFDTNNRVRLLSPDQNGVTWVRLTQNGFLGRTVEVGHLKCAVQPN